MRGRTLPGGEMNPVSPTVRTFFRLRRELIEVLGVDRRDIRPSTRLTDLVPVHQRRAVWRHLREQGLCLPELRLPRRGYTVAGLGCMIGAALAAGLLRSLLALLAIVHLAHGIWKVTRPFAVHLGCGPVTLREAAVYLTPYRDHPDYPWSRAEIADKVRLIISVSLGISLEDVQPESRFADLYSL